MQYSLLNIQVKSRNASMFYLHVLMKQFLLVDVSPEWAHLQCWIFSIHIVPLTHGVILAAMRSSILCQVLLSLALLVALNSQSLIAASQQTVALYPDGDNLVVTTPSGTGTIILDGSYDLRQLFERVGALEVAP